MKERNGMLTTEAKLKQMELFIDDQLKMHMFIRSKMSDKTKFKHEGACKVIKQIRNKFVDLFSKEDGE